jgi:hypothetical protein
VSGALPEGSAPSYGIERSFFKAFNAEFKRVGFYWEVAAGHKEHGD